MLFCAGPATIVSDTELLRSDPPRAKALPRALRASAPPPLRPAVEKAGGSIPTHLDDCTLDAAESSAPSTDGLTVGDWGERWLKRREREGLRAAKDDRRIWRTHVASEPWALLSLASMASPAGREMIVEWWTRLHEKCSSNPTHKRRTRVLAATTLRNIRQTVRKCFGDAVELGKLTFNPFASLRIARSRRRTTKDPIRVLFKEEQAPALALFKGWERLVLEFLIGSGLRLGEWRSLRLDDVQLTNEPTILVRFGGVSREKPDDPMAEQIKGAWFVPTKGGKARRVPLLEMAERALRAWLKQLRKFAPRNPHRLVFPMPDGRPRKKGRVFRGFARIAKLIGRSFTWHGCRHTCITSLVAGWWGEPWRKEAAQAFAGHSTVKMTERYVQFLEDAAVTEARRTNWGATMADVDETKSAEVEAGDSSPEEKRRFSSVVEQRFRNPEPEQKGDETGGSDAPATTSDAPAEGGDEPPSPGAFTRVSASDRESKELHTLQALTNGQLGPSARGLVEALVLERDTLRSERDEAIAQGGRFAKLYSEMSDRARGLENARDHAQAQALEMQVQRNEWRDEAKRADAAPAQLREIIVNQAKALKTTERERDDARAEVEHAKVVIARIVREREAEHSIAMRYRAALTSIVDGVVSKSEARRIAIQSLRDVGYDVDPPSPASETDDATARDLDSVNVLCARLRQRHDGLSDEAACELARFATCWWEAENRVRDLLAKRDASSASSRDEVTAALAEQRASFVRWLLWLAGEDAPEVRAAAEALARCEDVYDVGPKELEEVRAELARLAGVNPSPFGETPGIIPGISFHGRNARAMKKAAEALLAKAFDYSQISPPLAADRDRLCCAARDYGAAVRDGLRADCTEAISQRTYGPGEGSPGLPWWRIQSPDVDERAPDMATAAAAVAERDALPFGERATSRGLDEEEDDRDLRERHRRAIGLLTDAERALSPIVAFLSGEVSR